MTPDLATLYALVDLDTEDQPTRYDTEDEAHSAARFDNITHYEIWHGDALIAVVEPQGAIQ